MDSKIANHSIKAASITGFILCIINVLLIAFSQVIEISFFEIDLYHLVDVFLVLGLSIGIYRKSRLCAILLFLYFVLSQFFISITFQRAPGILSYVIALIFFQGIIGTFKYHRESHNSTSYNVNFSTAPPLSQKELDLSKEYGLGRLALIDKLDALRELRERGALTEEEYTLRRRDLMDAHKKTK